MATKTEVQQFTNTMIKLIIVAVLFLTVLIGGCSSTYAVKSGTRGVVLTFGKVTNIASDGFHFKIPFVQSVEIVDVKTQKAHSPANAGTKDIQQVATEVALNYHIDQSKLMNIYLNYGLDIEPKIIDPRIQECVKAVIAKYSAEDLLKCREAVKGEIDEMLKTSIGKYDIIVEDIQITDFQFTAAFNQAIEEKQIAEQSALKAENDLNRIKVEAEQRIATATAEAKAIEIQAAAIQKQGGKEYVTLKWVEAWQAGGSKVPNFVSGSGSSQFLMNVDGSK